MKIFITGIAGFLGSHLAKRLEKLGHEISGTIGNNKHIIFGAEIPCKNVQLAKIKNWVIFVIIQNLLVQISMVAFQITL